MSKKVRDVIDFLRRLFPEDLQEEWDNSGGFKLFPENDLKGIVLSLDPTLPAVEFAVEKGANLLITHHPLILSPIRNLDLPHPKGRIVELLFSGRVSLYSMHTNFDWAEGGMNDLFSEAVGARPVSWIEDIAVDGFKLVTFFPEDFNIGKLLEVADRRGIGGRMGNYSMCSFRGSGVGTFFPLEGSNPSVGEKGLLNEVPELRFEMRVYRSRLGDAVRLIRELHPYEEPPIELYPLKLPAGGRGRICSFEEAIPFDLFMDRILGIVSQYSAREPFLFGSTPLNVSKFGLCLGKGMSLYRAASVHGIDVFVTGDVGYHDLEVIGEVGVPVLDVGHESEAAGLFLMKDSLETFSEVFLFSQSFKGRGYERGEQQKSTGKPC